MERRRFVGASAAIAIGIGGLAATAEALTSNGRAPVRAPEVAVGFESGASKLGHNTSGNPDDGCARDDFSRVVANIAMGAFGHGGEDDSCEQPSGDGKGDDDCKEGGKNKSDKLLTGTGTKGHGKHGKQDDGKKDCEDEPKGGDTPGSSVPTGSSEVPTGDTSVPNDDVIVYGNDSEVTPVVDNGTPVVPAQKLPDAL